MKQSYLEAGKIVNTHGIRGEVKLLPWTDSADFLLRFSILYIDGHPMHIRSSFVHKGCLIVLFEGINDVDQAISLKNKVVHFSRDDAALEPGQFFLADIVGLEVRDARTNIVLGKVTEVLTPPANNVYVVSGEKRYMIPAVPEFILETNVDGGYLLVRTLEGMDG